MKVGRLYAVVIVLLVVVTVISLRFWPRKPIHHLHSDLPAVTVSPVTIEVQGQKFVREQQTLWQVSDWNFAHSQLTITNTDRHDRQIIIDLDRMKVLIPFKERDKRGDMMGLTQTEGPAWQTAFCPGDELSVSTDHSDNVIMIINIGHRKCASI